MFPPIAPSQLTATRFSFLAASRRMVLTTPSMKWRKREIFQLQLHAASLDLGEIEDVVDQREHVPPPQEWSSGSSASCFAASASSRSISLTPMMALSGVRQLCDSMLARNCDLCWLACCELRVLSPQSHGTAARSDRQHRLVGEGFQESSLCSAGTRRAPCAARPPARRRSDRPAASAQSMGPASAALDRGFSHQGRILRDMRHGLVTDAGMLESGS